MEIDQLNQGQLNMFFNDDEESPERERTVTAPVNRQQPQNRQRRGVEINLDRHIEDRRPANVTYNNDGVDDDEHPRDRRRVRLSKPLGLMATESLNEQKKTNSLLAELIYLVRKDAQ